MKKLLLAAILSVGMSAPAFADVVVIVNTENSASLSKTDIKRMFLGKKNKFANGTKVKPYYLAQGHAARDEFNKKVLGKSSSQIKAYWSKLIFTGKGTPPDALGDVSAVIKQVASEPGAIAYIEADAVTDAIKVIATY